MITFGEFPAIMRAFELIAADNGMAVRRDIAITHVPDAYVRKIHECDDVACILRGSTVDDLLSEDQIDEELVDRHECALDVVCSGEESVTLKLIEATGGEALHVLLNSAFDGDLHSTVYGS